MHKPISTWLVSERIVEKLVIDWLKHSIACPLCLVQVVFVCLLLMIHCVVSLADHVQWCGRTLITGGSDPHLRRFQGVVRSGESLRYDSVSELHLDGEIVSMNFDSSGQEVRPFCGSKSGREIAYHVGSSFSLNSLALMITGCRELWVQHLPHCGTSTGRREVAFGWLAVMRTWSIPFALIPKAP